MFVRRGIEMRTRVVAIILSAGVLLGGSVAAQDVWQTIKAKKVRVDVNRTAVDDGGYVIDGKTYVLLDALQESSHLLVDDADDVQVFDPDVHLFLFSGNRTVMRPFGNVFTGKYEFFAFAQIERMRTPIVAIRTTVVDPNGTAVETQTVKVVDASKEDFWYTSNAMRIDFKQAGTYLVRFSVKQSEESDFVVLAERKITAIKKEQ
jgi:hypothetical protein